MNHQKYKALLLALLLLLTTSSIASAILNDNDKLLNKNIKNFPPIYCNTKTIPWEYWGKKFEFMINLSDDEDTSPKPLSEPLNEFLGYKNKNTKLNILCNKHDPITNRLLSSQIIRTLDIDELSKSFIYLINDAGPQKKVEISIAVERTMHDIEVTESRTNLKLFKSYKPSRIFNISFNVKSAPESDTISSFSQDSVCYNLK